MQPTTTMDINNWRSPLVRLIILNMVITVAMCSHSQFRMDSPRRSPSGASSGASGLAEFKEDLGRMDVTAYMHKSITSKLALNKRSTLTRWAVDGATKPKSWYGKLAGGFFGGLASIIVSPLVAGAALVGKARQGCKEDFRNKETITFYWKGTDLWCKLPQETIGWQNLKKSNDGNDVKPEWFFQETKVAGIDGNFDDDQLVIRFQKTTGHEMATDRVIDTGSAYTNLKETLMWIRDSQGHRELLDRSVLQNIQGSQYDALKTSIPPAPQPRM